MRSPGGPAGLEADGLEFGEQAAKASAASSAVDERIISTPLGAPAARTAYSPAHGLMRIIPPMQN
jgi:hypothetical protein